jgi:hypothetical protein
LAFLPPWLWGLWLGSWGHTSAMCASGHLVQMASEASHSLRPPVCTRQQNLGGDLRNQENLEQHPSETGRIWVYQNRPLHERREEGLDHPLGTTSVPEPGSLVFVIIPKEGGIPSRLGLLGWMNV